MQRRLRLEPLAGLQLESAEALSRFAADAMQASGLDEATRLATLAVVEELGANVMEHSQAAWLEIDLAAREGVAFVMLRDNGKAFDPSAAIRRVSQGFVLEDRVDRSLGLYIVRQLARAIAYTRDGAEHNLVEIEIAPDPRPAQPKVL